MSHQDHPPGTQEQDSFAEIRRDLAALVARFDALLGGQPTAIPGTLPSPVPQTYPEGYDFRGDPEGLHTRAQMLLTRVSKLSDAAADLDPRDLYQEVRLRAAEARLLQTQVVDGTTTWETLVQVVKALTRVVSYERPGYVYGLASSHNTDWGKVIQDVLSSYTVIDL